jgi:hypothetical protein
MAIARQIGEENARGKRAQKTPEEGEQRERQVLELLEGNLRDQTFFLDSFEVLSPFPLHSLFFSLSTSASRTTSASSKQAGA